MLLIILVNETFESKASLFQSYDVENLKHFAILRKKIFDFCGIRTSETIAEILPLHQRPTLKDLFLWDLLFRNNVHLKPGLTFLGAEKN